MRKVTREGGFLLYVYKAGGKETRRNNPPCLIGGLDRDQYAKEGLTALLIVLLISYRMENHTPKPFSSRRREKETSVIIKFVLRFVLTQSSSRESRRLSIRVSLVNLAIIVCHY